MSDLIFQSDKKVIPIGDKTIGCGRHQGKGTLEHDHVHKDNRTNCR